MLGDILDASLRGLLSPQGCKMQRYCVLKQVVHIITASIESVVGYSGCKSPWPVVTTGLQNSKLLCAKASGTYNYRWY